jgi:SAM-dependent methyltransferase
MSSFWNRIYQTDSSFFGEEPSRFAILCYDNYMNKNNVRKMLELGCGQGRDALFFASKGIEVSALDYSNVAIDGLIEHAKEKNLLSNIRASAYDVKSMIPFKNEEFDTVYSHMFFNMYFKWENLKYMFQEVKRVLKDNAFNFFSVRNRNDKSYGKGRKIDNDDDDVYDLNGFQIRFFGEQQVKDLVDGVGFEILDIREVYEEPVTLYLVSTMKRE